MGGQPVQVNPPVKWPSRQSLRKGRALPLASPPRRALADLRPHPPSPFDRRFGPRRPAATQHARRSRISNGWQWMMASIDEGETWLATSAADYVDEGAPCLPSAVD